MSNTSSIQRYKQLKEWLLSIKSAPKPATRLPKKQNYGRK